jgi:P-type E1-E2 ATPase
MGDRNRRKVIRIAIPGRGTYAIEHVVLDLNGTIGFDGRIIRGVREKLTKLSQHLDVIVVTADTNQNAEALLGDLPVVVHKVKEGQEHNQKLEVVLQKGSNNTMSIGNGCNDVSMLKESALGICVVGREGASPEAMMASDLVAPTINDALDLLFKPNRLRATLRR